MRFAVEPLTPPSPVRLLWITQNYPGNRGGMAEACDRIVRCLRKERVRVDVAHLHRRLQRAHVECQSGGLYIGCPLGEDPAHSVNQLWEIITHALEGPEYSHVIAFGGVLPLIAGPVFSAWLQAPLVTLLRGNDLDVGLFTPHRSDVLFRAISASSEICTVTREHAAKIERLFPGLKPRWIPNGINLEQWRPLPSDRRGSTEWRAANVEPGRQVLGIFGHIRPKKGTLFFLESLIGSGVAPQFHLLFVGDLDPAIQAWLSAEGQKVAHSVIPFLDRLDLLTWYLACDWIVLSSLYDGLPNVLVEAAALGIPFLASRAGGMADFLEDRRHGYLFHPVDQAGCGTALRRAASTSPATRLEFGAAVRDLAEKEFPLHRETDRYLEVFRETPSLPPKELDGRPTRMEHPAPPMR